MITSKQAFEFIFGHYGINDAGFKIWEAAVNWERQEMLAKMKRYRDRNKESPLKRQVAENIIDGIKLRIKKDGGGKNV